MEVVPVLLLSPTVTVTVEYDARVVPVSSNRGQPRWLVRVSTHTPLRLLPLSGPGSRRLAAIPGSDRSITIIESSSLTRKVQSAVSGSDSHNADSESQRLGHTMIEWLELAQTGIRRWHPPPDAIW